MVAKSSKAHSAGRERPMRAGPQDELFELRHRLTNSLQLVLALIAKESANSQDPEVKAALQRLAESVQELTPPLETEQAQVGH